MTRKKLYLFLSAAFIIALSACGNYGDNYRENSARVPYERRVNRRSMSRNTVRHRPTPRPDQVMPQPTPLPYSTNRSAIGHGQPHTPIQHGVTEQEFSPPTAIVTPATPFATAQPPPESQNPINQPGAIEINTETNNEQQINLSNKRQLSNHKTNFDASDTNRSTNIAQASNSINGHIVNPGETFSYNQTVGPTIERRGYKESIIYVEGEKKEGFGGGVCQVSTTLSIAADEAGMTIIERHDHSRPVSYAEEGEEAATSYGGIDFKFKNEKPFAVMINSHVQDGTVYVNISEA